MTKTKRNKIKRVIERGEIYHFKDGAEMYRRRARYGHEYVLRGADGHTIDISDDLNYILEYLSDD